jgi:hypothetical protein
MLSAIFQKLQYQFKTTGEVAYIYRLIIVYIIIVVIIINHEGSQKQKQHNVKTAPV